jgi:hypothetical protein
MANSFDGLVKRTTTKKTQAKAARRAQELLGTLLVSELRRLLEERRPKPSKVGGV